METEPHKVFVIDDQIGQQEDDRADFLEAVGYYQSAGSKQRTSGYPYEYEFHTGQDEAGKNSVESVKEAVFRCWPAADGKRWALVLLDVRFGRDDKFGFTLLHALREDPRFGKDLPIVMLTSEGKGKKDEADKLNADGFFPKADEKGNPLWSEHGLKEKVLRYGLIPDDRDLNLIEATHTTRLLGNSLSWLKVLREARRYALDLRGSRILYGETGTGKTELAGYIHCFTARRGGPYVHWFADKENEELVKSELFGCWKGAHDQADFPYAGKIEEAYGGTFFLDEVANLPGGIQTAFLQFRKPDSKGWRTLTRLGKFPSGQGKKAESERKEALESVVPGAILLPDHRIQVDVLLLTGTKEDLENPEVRQKLGFRNDLHNALGTPLRCPPLNARRGDIPQLFEAFVRRFLSRPGSPLPNYHIEPSVLNLLKERNWSQRGNVRDLERIAEYAAQNLGDFGTIRIDRLPEDIQQDAKRKYADPSFESVKNVEASVVPALSDSARATAESASYAHGSLTRAELEHLRRRACLLEEAAEVTRKVDAATGVKARYQPTLAVSRLMGKKVTTTNAKRIIKDILGTILNTPDFLVEAYGRTELEGIREWVQTKPALVALHRYSIGEIGADEIN